MGDVVRLILRTDRPGSDLRSAERACSLLTVIDGLVERLCGAADEAGPPAWRLIHSELFSGEDGSIGSRTAQALSLVNWILPLDDDPDDDHEDDVAAWRRAFADAFAHVRAIASRLRRLAEDPPDW